MKRLLPLFASVWVALLPGSTASADPTTKLSCPHADGFLQGPFIPDETAARRVFMAYRATIRPHPHHQQGAKVFVEDDGDRWAVFEGLPIRNTGGKLVVPIGGGGLGLVLDKCSGAILFASFQR